LVQPTSHDLTGTASPTTASDARSVLREGQSVVDNWLHPFEGQEQSDVLTLLREKEY